MKTNNSKINQLRGSKLLGWLPIFLMMLVAQVTFAQSVITVKGVVLDDLGEPVMGANVIERGTTNGVTTDFDGNFTLQVRPSATLNISFIGFATQEVQAVSGKTMVITLSEDSQLLEDVVVVGYGAQKKESVVGAISQLSNKDMQTTPVANVSNAIAGKIPGVITTQGSGAPGADDATINIRGRATFGDSNPLVLVDGIERSMNQVAPDDIESISVLKDASATAVYGVRGANGVILVTTKRGRDQKPEVSFSASWQMQSPTRKDTYLGTVESVKLLNEAYANDGLASPYANYSDAQIAALPNVDWYGEVLKDYAPAQRYDVSVRGGTKRMRYYSSVEYYKQNGLVDNLSNDTYGNSSAQRYQRFAFRANMDLFLTKDLTFSINFGTRFENRGGSNTNESAGYSETFYLLNHTPGWIFPVSYQIPNGTNEDGSVAYKTLYGGNSQYQTNIVAALTEGGYHTATNTITETNFILDYKLDWITPGLSAKGMFSFDYNSYYKKLFSRTYATYELNDASNAESIDAYTMFNTDGELTFSGSSYTEMKIYQEYQLNYARKFGNHDITAMALYNQNARYYNADQAFRYQGIVGRVTYNYGDRYLAEFNAGYNGSENFAEGQRFGFFPAVSVGWRVVGEDFMKSTENWLDNLKIRASYGEVGNDKLYVNGALQRFLFREKWTEVGNDYYFGTTGKTGYYESMYPNYDVTWERARKFNVGLEFGLWNGLLNGNIDFFYEKRDDILTEYLSRPQWVGVQMAAGNLGKTKNSGFEIELHHFKQVTDDFSYNLGLNFSHAANEITDMDEPDLKTSYRMKEGNPIGQYFGLVADGFITQSDIDNGYGTSYAVSSFAQSALKAGDLKYVDQNGDGFIDDRDETTIGYSDIPENTWSATAGCSWKGWSFSIMFQGVNHVSRYYDAEAMYAFVNGGKVKEHHLDRWNPSLSESENLANAKYPLLHYDSYGEHNQRQNSFFLKDGSFVRLKNIELGYEFPEKWLKPLHISGLRLYVNANNLVTWDDLNDLVDPESNGSNKYPIMKAYNFGLNLKF